ncbi:hypothetical protein CU098_000029, partial [Rhizopus stolonifer]
MTSPSETLVPETAELVLKVHIIQARSLSREDEFNAPSPFVDVCFGGIRHRTDTIKKSSDPAWDCSFEFNLSSDILGHKKRMRALKRHGLTFNVYSKDRFTSIFLGRVNWPLDQLFEPNQTAFEENEAKWYSLSSHIRRRKRFHLKKKRQDIMAETEQGEIYLQYGLEYKTDKGTAHTDTMWEEWQSLLDDKENESAEAEIDATDLSVPEMRTSSSTTSFSQRLKNPLKKNNSSSSVNSLVPQSEKRRGRRRKLRSKFSRKRPNKSNNNYAKFFSNVTGITFLEIESAQDLPPERNVTRTGFDMDPFVIVTYGVCTFRTRAIRHNLNPVWNEKLFFHVKSTQENYKLKFAVYDKDKFSSNDFVASQEIILADILSKTQQDVDSSQVQGDHTPFDEIDRSMGRCTIPLTLAKPDKWTNQPTLTFRAKFVPYVEIRKMFWVALARTCDSDNSNTMSRLEVQTMLETLGSNISEATLDKIWKENGKDPSEDLTMDELVKSLESFMLNLDTEEGNIDPNTIVETEKDVPVDMSQSKTSNPFFLNGSDEEEEEEETSDAYDESAISDSNSSSDVEYDSYGEYDDTYDTNTTTPQTPDEADYEALAEADGIQYVEGPLHSLKLQQRHEAEHDLEAEDQDDKPTQEKVIRLKECPICHKPNLSKRMQMDIVTHVATCAANDWTTVDRFLMGNFGTEAQAQRRWFVKLVSKVSYGKYSAGQNNANIIVQDRSTGQLIDERMSVYIRLGMRLLYKGMKTGIQSKTAQRILTNMTIKQGRRFDHPLSKREIGPFIKFHKLDMSQVLEPVESFETFNEFFYRKLKPDARPCDAKDNKRVVVSPADCRMLAFPTVDDATRIWIKGIEFSLSKLLDDPHEAQAFDGGALAIFRLAPQDYHRYHSPVDGTIRKIHHVEGQYYTVNPMAIRTTLDVYGDNKRDVVYMDTEVFGKVAIVCIGAMMVGSIILTAKEG